MEVACFLFCVMIIRLYVYIWTLELFVELWYTMLSCMAGVSASVMLIDCLGAKFGMDYKSLI